MNTTTAPTVDRGRRDLPSLTEVARIAAQEDSVLANLQITLAYHRISAALAEMLGPTVNWCTFAIWASKQAGQTIREEDLARTFERIFDRSPEAARELDRLVAGLPGPAEIARESGPDVRARLRAALRPLEIFARTSEAIAAGNRMVFAEIGAEFVRFVDAFRDHHVFDEVAIERFCAALRPGEPPAGQGHLRKAFRALYRAKFERWPWVKTQLILTASFEVGFHEQTRLQPEITAALDAPVVDLRRLRRRVLRALFPRLGAALGPLVDLYLSLATPIDRVWDAVLARVRRVAREAITEGIATLALPGGRLLRLGRDLATPFPASVRAILVPELAEILAVIDPTPDDPRASGAEDWADFDERMHYVADFFRSHVEDRSLLGPPFDPEQIAAIDRGRLPAGRL